MKTKTFPRKGTMNRSVRSILFEDGDLSPSKLRGQIGRLLDAKSITSQQAQWLHGLNDNPELHCSIALSNSDQTKFCCLGYLVMTQFPNQIDVPSSDKHLVCKPTENGMQEWELDCFPNNYIIEQFGLFSREGKFSDNTYIAFPRSRTAFEDESPPFYESLAAINDQFNWPTVVGVCVNFPELVFAQTL